MTKSKSVPAETVTDCVTRLYESFKNGNRKAVVTEIVAMPSNRAAIVSVRLYQHVCDDSYNAGCLARMLEATTYKDEE